MGRRLSREEKSRICELKDQGKSNIKIAKTVSEEFSRFTLERSTIQRVLKRRPPGEAVRDLCGRAAHLWVRETLSSRTPFKDTDAHGQPAGYSINVGKRKTCRYCGKTEVTSMVKVESEGEETIPSDFGIRVSPPILQPVT